MVRTPDVVPLSKVPLFIFPVIESLIYGQAEGRVSNEPPHSSSPCQLSTRESCCFLYRVNNKSGKSSLFWLSTLSWGSHLLQNSHHLLFNRNWMCRLLVDSRYARYCRGYGTSSFSCACVSFVCLHCIVCVLLPKHLLASSPCIPWFHNQDGYRIAFP